MDINQLEVLVAVGRERSFSRAAEALGKSQPAVSQSISRLEKELGESLFDRSSKDGTLTDAGELLIKHAKHILNLRENAVNAISDLRDLKFGKVTLSANEHTVFAILPIIEKFGALYPSVKIEVKRGAASRIPEEIISRQVELGVLSFKPDDDEIKSISIGTDHLVLVVPESHRLAKRKDVSIKELESERFIAHNARSPYRKLVLEAFEKQKTNLQIAIELPSLEAIKRLVVQGCGVALVPRLTAHSEIVSGQLVAIEVKDLKVGRNLNIVHRRNASLSHAAREFIDVARKMPIGTKLG